MPTTRVLTARRTWLMPVVLVVGLAAALPAIYLSATASPQAHLEGLPIALVVEPQEPTSGPAVAEQLRAAIEAGAGEGLGVTSMTSGELALAMREDRVAAAVVIPGDFDVAIASLFPGATVSSRPTVTIATNAGDGGLSNGLAIGNLTPLLGGVADAVGSQLVEGSPDPLPAANAALLRAPFQVAVAPYTALPADSGLGTSAFYYALVLVLIAFIGASLISPLVDAALGIVPTEIGPLVARAPYTVVSRRRAFVAKTAILVASAPFAASVVQAVAALFGVVAPSAVTLWLFSTVAIAAIGTSALAVFAALGPGVGSLVNTLYFVALAMVSSGGIVPLEATPPFFRVVSAIAPFRDVIDGTRSLFYFDGNLAAGLGDAWIDLVVGGALGLVVGLVVTTLYGRVRRFSRYPHPVSP